MKLVDENRNKNYDEFCKKQFNEAFDEARDVLIDYDLYTEGFGNTILNKIKSGLQKVCPSPEKIKDFMSKYAQRIDDKLKNCKEKWFVDAWNNLKKLAQNMDNQQANESFAMYLESIGEDLNDIETENYDYLNESLYEEGFFDRLKAGVDAFKNAGKNQPEQKTTSKQTFNKSSKMAEIIKQTRWSQEDALKPENVKKIALSLNVNRKFVPGMVKNYFASKDKPQINNVNADAEHQWQQQGNSVVNGQTILGFLKKHWKMIAIILIAAIAWMWAGPLVGAKFLIGPTIRQACKLVGGKKGGALIGTVGAVGATMAMGGIGGDDVDVGDADADADGGVSGDDTVDADDTNVDSGNSEVKGDMGGDGDNDIDDSIIRRGNKDWEQNLDDKDRSIIGKLFEKDQKYIAANGYATMNHGGDTMFIQNNLQGGFTANVQGVEYVNVDPSGNLVDMNGKPLDLDQELKKIASGDPRFGSMKAKFFANGFYGLQRMIKAGGGEIIKNLK